MYKHHWRKIALVVIITLPVIILAPFIFINSYLKPKLVKKLKAAVQVASNSLYQIDFSKAELHLLQGKAVLYNVKLIPDTDVYRKMKTNGIAPALLYRLQVKQMLISGVHLFKLYFHKQLEIGQVTLTNPEVHVSEYAREDQHSTPKNARTLYQKLPKSLKSIQVGAINLDNIRFTYQTFIGPKPETGVLQHMGLEATDLLIDSATQHDLHRTLYCREIDTRLDNFSGTTADGLYQFKFRSVRLSTQQSRLTLTGLTMLPLPAAAFFAKSNLDHFNLYLDSVSVNGINVKTVRMRPDVDVTKITARKGRFNIYPNPHAPVKKGDRKASFPNSVIGHLKSILSVDTLDLQDINISYTEFNKASGNAGTISFNHTTGRFLHISNKKERVARYPWGTARLTTYLMGKGKLNLLAGFKLNDEQEHIYYSGHLGPMDLRDGNTALVPLGLARAATGTVKSLDFAISGSEKATVGKVTFLYNDLKAELLRHNENGYTKRTLATLAANLILLKHNNPDEANATPRSASVIYVRPRNVAFFQSIWLTVFSGIKPCAGLGKANAPTDGPLTKKELRQQKRAFKKAKKAAVKD